MSKEVMNTASSMINTIINTLEYMKEYLEANLISEEDAEYIQPRIDAANEAIGNLKNIGNPDLLNPLCLAGNSGKIHIVHRDSLHKDWTLCGRIPTKIIGYSSQREGVTCNTCRKIWEKFIMEVTNDTAFLYEHK